LTVATVVTQTIFYDVFNNFLGWQVSITIEAYGGVILRFNLKIP